jgi:YVTN family beta-propeller protein
LKNLFFFAFLFAFLGCVDSPENSLTPDANRTYTRGFFIPCEGTYGFGNASISFFDTDLNTSVNDIFFSVNKKKMGDQVQSMTIVGNETYIVVQNSQKIVVVNTDSFTLKKNIVSSTYLTSPRYLTAVSATKAYVSDWNTNALIILDLQTKEILGKISVGKSPDQMLLVGSKLYVCNSGYASAKLNDNTISVIDTKTDQVLTEIVVGDRPKSMVLDNQGKIWVACLGFKVYDNQGNFDASSSPGSLWRIDTSTYSIDKKFLFTTYDDNPSNLCASPFENFIYYSNKGKVYKQNVTAQKLEGTVFLNRSLYGFKFDRQNSQVLWACVSSDFTSTGKLIKYQNQIAVDSFNVGVAPNAIVFK